MTQRVFNQRELLLLYLFCHFTYSVCAEDEPDATTHRRAFRNRVVPPAAREAFREFRLRVQGNPHHYQPGNTYRVALYASASAYFSGFTLVALKEGKKGENLDDYAGNFQVTDGDNAHLMSSCPPAVTERSSRRCTKVHVFWTAPLAGSGCVTLKASVLRNKVVSFQNVDFVTKTICEKAARAADDSRLHDTAEGHTTQCCACGMARYRLTFYGNWSEELHPKDYPKGSSHWSSIIGASHSKRYMLWEYGGYASEGIRQLAELGSPVRVEQEIREKGNEILTVLKAKDQWPAWRPLDVRPAPTVEFLVDRMHHVISFLTMLGPSPDWAAGLSAEDLCTPECGWVRGLAQDLLPWDAGVDSGISYESPAMPTVPQERIRPLTSRENPRGPFHDPKGGPIRPIARVVLERIARKGEQCSVVSDTVDDILVDVQKKQEDSTPETKWSPCLANSSPNCGKGRHTRQKMVGAWLNQGLACVDPLGYSAEARGCMVIGWPEGNRPSGRGHMTQILEVKLRQQFRGALCLVTVRTKRCLLRRKRSSWALELVEAGSGGMKRVRQSSPSSSSSPVPNSSATTTSLAYSAYTELKCQCNTRPFQRFY